MENKRRRRTKKKSKSKAKKVFFSIIAIFLICAAGIYAGIHLNLNKVKRLGLPEDLGITEEAEKVKNKKIINIALFGIDSRNKNEDSRSDTIMVVSIDKEHNKIKVTSLMRDMYVNIPDHGENRINSAYQYGGPALAIKTINSNFDLDIKDFVTVDFFSLEKLIDEVGGVEINVSKIEVRALNACLNELNVLNGDKVKKVTSGLQLLNGRQAVAYARIRSVGNSDYERTERQRRVLNELYKKIKAQGAAKLPGIINAACPYVETSLSNNEIMTLALSVLNIGSAEMEQNRLPVTNGYKSQCIKGMDVLVPDIAMNKEAILKFIYEELYNDNLQQAQQGSTTGK